MHACLFHKHYFSFTPSSSTARALVPGVKLAIWSKSAKLQNSSAWDHMHLVSVLLCRQSDVEYLVKITSSDNHISIMDNQNFHSHHHAPTFQHTLLHWMLHQNFCTICHLHWTCRQLHGFFQSGFAVHATFRSYFSSLMPNGNIWLEGNVYSQQFMQKLLQRIPVFVSILWILGSVVLQFPKNEMFQTWNE